MQVQFEVASGVGQSTAAVEQADLDSVFLNSASGDSGEEMSADPVRSLLSTLIVDEMPFLERVARRWHRKVEDAEDLVQQTIVRMLANAHAWQPGSNFQAWAFTVMRNQFRANWSRGRREADAVAEMERSGPVQTPDKSETRLIVRDVQSALERLSQHQRETILLVGVEGKSYQAVAESLGISVAAVRCHLARARERLRMAVNGTETASPCDGSPKRPPLARLAGRRQATLQSGVFTSTNRPPHLGAL